MYIWLIIVLIKKLISDHSEQMQAWHFASVRIDHSYELIHIVTRGVEKDLFYLFKGNFVYEK